MSYLLLEDFLQRFRLFFLCINNRREFFKFFENKTVAIVGNATSLLGKKYGKQIDSHDIVIRFNRGYIINEEAQGVKTTVWASSLYIDELELKQKFPGINHIIWLTPKLSLMKEYSLNVKKRMIIYPFLEWFKLYKRMNNTRPTSGAMLIDFLVNNVNFSSIDIYGFDFFRTNSFYNTTRLNSLIADSPHKFNQEEVYLRNLITEKERIKINN